LQSLNDVVDDVMMALVRQRIVYLKGAVSQIPNEQPEMGLAWIIWVIEDRHEYEY
jgi:hypothetical protein